MKQGDVTTQDEATILPVQKVGHITRVMNAATATVAYTGVGFRPTAILFIGAVAITNYVAIGLKGGGDRYLFSNATNSDWSISTSNTFAFVSAGESQSAFVASKDIDGFTINWTLVGSPPGTATIAYMAFK